MHSSFSLISCRLLTTSCFYSTLGNNSVENSDVSPASPQGETLQWEGVIAKGTQQDSGDPLMEIFSAYDGECQGMT